MRRALDRRQLRALLRAYFRMSLRGTGMRWTFPLVHLGAVVLLVAFTTATIVFTYGLVGRFVDRNRFGSVAAWSQAGLSAAFLGFSQVLAHLLELPRFRLDRAYALVYPPAWFAALDVLGAAAPPPRAVPLSLLAVAATLGLGWLAVARLAPGSAGALAQLGEAPTLRARRGRPSPAAERAPGRLA